VIVALARRSLLPFLLALLVIRLWLTPLPSSFWLDETATVFVAQHGSHDPSLNDVAPQAWRSWYYPVIHLWGTLFGFSEAVTRVPSILAMLVALVLVARLSKRLIHPESAWFAVFACFALAGMNYQAANARPYALGMCLFAAALLFLVRWLDSAAWLDALLFVACAASVLYVHLLFWPSCLVFALYATIRIALGQTPIGWGRAATVFALLGIAVVPVAIQTVDLMREARAHVIARPPSLAQFLRSLQLPLIAVCAAGTWLVARVRKWRPDKTAPAPSTPAIVLIAGWWLFQPVLLFGFSWLTGDSVFVPRYLQLALPGVALAATAAAARFVPLGRWRSLSALLAIGALLYLGQWRELWPRHHNSDWRAAAAAVNQFAGEVPVICPSPFVEARPPAWRPDYPLPGFLYAHLSVYPIRGRVYLFPFESSPEADSFASTLAQGTLRESRRFLIFGWEPQVHFWRDWFGRRAEFSGWSIRRLGPFADVDVVEFVAPGR
jgi:mannosyltransferase